jgi:hypothetical protein
MICSLRERGFHDGAEDCAYACEVIDERSTNSAKVSGGNSLENSKELRRNVAFELHVRGLPMVIVNAEKEHT